MLEKHRQRSEILRYVVNGICATTIHFGVLTIALEVFHLRYASVASLIATIFGISASFLGNRYYVFRSSQKDVVSQAANFAGLYFSIAILHAGTLAILTDWLKIDFRIGFLIATALQTTLSYLGNKSLIFAK